MTYTTIDKAACQKLRQELNEVLSKFGEEAGLKLTIGNMKFSATSVEFKTEAVIEGAKSFKQQSRESNLDMYLQMYNLKRENNTYELVGYDSRKYKRPFIIRSKKDNKQYVCDLQMAEAQFKIAA